jgi:asparagine synthase (glutamine-hydrolysing)
MSGIAGILRFDGQPVDRRDLERMAGTLRAHGPDRRGIYAVGEIGLAHLLMQLTPEDLFDRQPLRGASGAVMTADVRLDNRDDVASALALDRDTAKMASDSALVLAAWERWGDEAWARLRGPFAAAIWNPNARVLTLVRDPLGLGVVVWHRGAGFFAFATLPKGLFALADVPREINEEKFADFLVLNHADHETTLYRDIFRLPLAHVASIDTKGSVRMRRYWSFDAIKPVRLKSDEAYAEAMREQLDRAVRRQLRSIHPVGCFLSGGLDSSSVAALAARALTERGKRLAAYTQVPRKGFDGQVGRSWYADETPFVEAIRQALPTIDVTYVDNSACDDFAELEGVFHATDTPFRNPTNLGWMTQIIRLARANKQRVLLCGDMGNATISWDGWAQAVDHLLAGRLWTAYRLWRQYYRASSNSRGTAFRELFVDRLAPIPLAAWAARLRHPRRAAPWQDHAVIRPDFAAAMDVETRARRVGHDFLYRPQNGWRDRTAMLTQVDYRGEWYAGMLAAHGVEMRDPTSDVDVIGFCLGVPVEQFLVEGVSRSLVRRALWGILPPQVLTNRRRGAQAADWFEKLRRRLPAIEAEIADLDRSALARKAIDLDRLRTAVRTWPSGNWHERKVIDEYQLALPRGFAMGRFARWFERTN